MTYAEELRKKFKIVGCQVVLGEKGNYHNCDEIAEYHSTDKNGKVWGSYCEKHKNMLKELEEQKLSFGIKKGFLIHKKDSVTLEFQKIAYQKALDDVLEIIEKEKSKFKLISPRAYNRMELESIKMKIEELR